MLNSVVRNSELLLCNTCMDARGITDENIVEGAKRSNLKELAERGHRRQIRCWFSNNYLMVLRDQFAGWRGLLQRIQ